MFTANGRFLLRHHLQQSHFLLLLQLPLLQVLHKFLLFPYSSIVFVVIIFVYLFLLFKRLPPSGPLNDMMPG